METHTENSNTLHREDGGTLRLPPAAVSLDIFRQRFPYTLIVGDPAQQRNVGVVESEPQFSREVMTLLETRIDSPILGRGRLGDLVILNFSPRAILTKESKLRFHQIPENYELLPSVVCSFTRMLPYDSQALRSPEVMQTMREQRRLSRFEAVCVSLNSEYPSIGKLLVHPSAEALVSTIQWTRLMQSPSFNMLNDFYGIRTSAWSEQDTLYDQLYAGKNLCSRNEIDRSPRAVSCGNNSLLTQIYECWDSQNVHMPIGLDVTNLIRLMPSRGGEGGKAPDPV